MNEKSVRIAEIVCKPLKSLMKAWSSLEVLAILGVQFSLKIPITTMGDCSGSARIARELGTAGEREHGNMIVQGVDMGWKSEEAIDRRCIGNDAGQLR